MAIYVPGIRDRHNKTGGKGKREVVVILSLTAMVDMFTVLVVFLLQNYKVDAIKLTKAIELPEAQAIKKLLPAHVVAVSETEVYVDDKLIMSIQQVKDHDYNVIEPIKAAVENEIRLAKETAVSSFRSKIRQSVVDPAVIDEEQKKIEEQASRVTVQAAKETDFLTLKKVLLSITEAGAEELNFAVAEKAKIQN